MANCIWRDFNKIWGQFNNRRSLSGVNLRGKRILVTGVSAGLGVETARSLAAHGAQVVGAARDLKKARAVIAGHKRLGNDDGPGILGETRQYIRDFERLAMQTTTAQELYDQMLNLYPDWGNRGALWSSARAIRT